jgi:serine/threonine-protein phosphatase 2B catalytic subunit
LREGHINKAELVDLINKVIAIFKNEPNVIRIKEPVIIIGDIHGQYYDLIHMFEKVVDQRSLSKTNMLFLGDYVDRGNYSIEVCIFLFALKIAYPNSITMLRGNHESRAMTEHFTFREEVLAKYDNDESIYELFMDVFALLPIAAEVNGDYLCMHGGISPELVTVEDINKIDRKMEPPLSGFLCDLLWSDPIPDKDAKAAKWTKNTERECSYKFGLDPIRKVLKKNGYLSIIRAHQVQIDGYKMHKWEGNK